MEEPIENIAYYYDRKKVILVETDEDKQQGLISFIAPVETMGKKGLSQRRTPKDNVVLNNKFLTLRDEDNLILWIINNRDPLYTTLLNKYNQAN